MKKREKVRQKERGHRGVRRVEGEIYLPAACADKIIRQKMPGVDDGKPGEGNVQEKEKGRGLRDQVRTSGGKTKKRTNAGEIG